MGRGNRPTPEFRREAVRLALTSGRTRREIADARDRFEPPACLALPMPRHQPPFDPGTLGVEVFELPVFCSPPVSIIWVFSFA